MELVNKVKNSENKHAAYQKVRRLQVSWLLLLPRSRADGQYVVESKVLQERPSLHPFCEPPGDLWHVKLTTEDQYELDPNVNSQSSVPAGVPLQGWLTRAAIELYELWSALGANRSKFDLSIMAWPTVLGPGRGAPKPSGPVRASCSSALVAIPAESSHQAKRRLSLWDLSFRMIRSPSISRPARRRPPARSRRSSTSGKRRKVTIR